MAGIDIRRFLNNFTQNYTQQAYTAKSVINNSVQSSATQSGQTSQTASLVQNLSQSVDQTLAQNLQLNTLQNIDRSIYAKDVLQLPRNVNELIYMLQRGMTQAQFNQMFSAQIAAQRNTLSQLQAQILAQLQGLNTTTVDIRLTNQLQDPLKNLEILSGGMIRLDQIAQMFQINGKDAITKLIMSMTQASKSGITDLSQMKEMAKLINASVSIASENNPQKTLKLLLMLYLPWLPLEDGVGFDLEIQQKNDSSSESDSILTITVTTINYGIVRATLILETSNSVHVFIEAIKEFPRQELQLRIEKEQKHYAMDSVLSFENNDNIKPVEHTKQAANINMSKTTEINPYMLLMAHTLIKHIIDIDNNKTMGITSHTD